MKTILSWLALLLAGVVLAVVSTAGAASADDENDDGGKLDPTDLVLACQVPGPFDDMACDPAEEVAEDVVGQMPGADKLSGTLGELTSSIQGVADALEAIESFSPDALAEEWAQYAAESAVGIMSKISDFIIEIQEPAYGQGWWMKQLAITTGLAWIVFAFLLPILLAKMGGSGGSVSATAAFRESGLRLPFVPILMTAGPALLFYSQGIFAELATVFADQGHEEASNAASAFVISMADTFAPTEGHDTAMTVLGGAFAALIILGLVVFLGVIVMVEMAFAAWGSNVVGLLIPLAIAFWIYPPWRRSLAKLIMFLVGLWLAPAAVNFVYWSMWSAAGSIAEDPLKVTLYVLVSMLMLAAAPFIAVFVLPKAIPEYQAAHPRGGSKSGSSGSSSRSDRMESRRSQSAERAGQAEASPGRSRGTGTGGRGGDSTSGDPGPQTQPGTRQQVPVGASEQSPSSGGNGSTRIPASSPGQTPVPQVGAPAGASGTASAGSTGGAAGGAAGSSGGAAAGAGSAAAAGAAGPVGIAAVAAAGVAKAKDKAKEQVTDARDRLTRGGD